MKRKRAVLAVALFLGGISGFSYSVDDTSSKPDCPARVSVLVAPVQPGVFREIRSFSAVFAPESVEVESGQTGLVTDMKVSDGDRVSRGFILVMLNEGMSDGSAEIRSELDKWKKTLWKQEHWKERNPAAEERSRRRIAELEAQLESFVPRGSEGHVKAPMAGIVELEVVPGTEVEEGDVVARIINRRRKYARLEPAVEDRAIFSPGRTIDLGGGYQAVVAENSEKGVLLTVEDPADRLGDDLKRFDLIRREETGAVVLPAADILRDENGPYVFVAQGRTARRADITAETEADGRVLVSRGLESGDLVITHQVLSARSGEKTKSLDCLSQGKRVRPMIIDPETGFIVRFKREKE